MALLMTRPTKHPRTGTYLVRLAIPQELRETTKRMFGVQAEFQENLKTKDPTEAKHRAPEALARLRSKLDRARAIVAEAPAAPTRKEIAALAGEWYRRRVGANGSHAEQDLHWEIALELADDDPRAIDPTSQEFAPYSTAWASRLLEGNGFATDAESVRRLTDALMRAEGTFREALKRHIDGDWSPPRWQPAEVPPASHRLAYVGSNAPRTNIRRPAYRLGHGPRLDGRHEAHTPCVV